MRAGLCPRCALSVALANDRPAEPAPLQQLGDYELLDEIARGGMGVVWRARQRRLNRIVALKLVRESHLPGEDAARRFRIEAEAAAQLRHRHIVAVHEVGEVGGRYFLSMELLAGGSLADRLQRERLSSRVAAELLAKIARAVQHAHERGVLHRDLKPANILLDDVGEPRVTDFGLARLVHDDSSLTLAGQVLGTPAYMSPEQARGDTAAVTVSSDVYSLGAILYELLTGQPPFRGDRPIEVLRRVTDEEPARPSSLTQVDPDLETICLKSLEKQPGGRYPSAVALAEDLERWVAGVPINARRITAPERVWKWARRAPAWAALWSTIIVALIVISIGGTVFNLRLREQRRVAEEAVQATLHRLAAQHVETARHLTDGGDWHRALLHLAEAIQIGDGELVSSRVNRIRFAALARLAPHLANLWFLDKDARLRAEFTPDGEKLLIFHNKQAYLCNGQTGAALGPPLRHADWIADAEASPDGTRVLCGSERAWTLWDPQKGSVVATGNGRLRSALGPENVVAPAIFGGSWFVVADGSEARIFSSVDGTRIEPTVLHNQPVLWALLSPDARHVFSLTQDGQFHISFRATARPVKGSPIQLGAAAHLASVNLEKKLLAIQTGRSGLAVVEWEKAKLLFQRELPETILAQGWTTGREPLALTRQSEGLAVRDSASGFPLWQVSHGARGKAGAFDALGRSALTVAWDGSALMWDHSRGRALSPRLWCVGFPLGGAMSSDGLRVAMRSNAIAVWLWRAPSNAGAIALELGFSPRAIAFSDDSAELHAVGEKGAKLAFEVDGSPLRNAPELRPQRWPATRVADEGGTFVRLSADGRRELRWRRGRSLVAGAVELRDLSAVEAPLISLPHPGTTNDACFSPDGRFVGTANSDQTARLWNARTGEPVGSPIPHPSPVTGISFSPDSSLLTTQWGGDYTRIWETSTGGPVTPPLFHPDATETAWSPDGNWLGTSGASNQVRLWNVRPSALSPPELRVLAQALSAHRLLPHRDSGFVQLSRDELRAAWRLVGALRQQ